MDYEQLATNRKRLAMDIANLVGRISDGKERTEVVVKRCEPVSKFFDRIYLARFEDSLAFKSTSAVLHAIDEFVDPTSPNYLAAFEAILNAALSGVPVSSEIERKET